MVFFDDGQSAFQVLGVLGGVFQLVQLDADAGDGSLQLVRQGGDQVDPVVPLLFLDQGYGGIQGPFVFGLRFPFRPAEEPASQQVEQDADKQDIEGQGWAGQEGVGPDNEGKGRSFGIPDAAVVAGDDLQMVSAGRQLV